MPPSPRVARDGCLSAVRARLHPLDQCLDKRPAVGGRHVLRGTCATQRRNPSAEPARGPCASVEAHRVAALIHDSLDERDQCCHMTRIERAHVATVALAGSLRRAKRGQFPLPHARTSAAAVCARSTISTHRTVRRSCEGPLTEQAGSPYRPTRVVRRSHFDFSKPPIGPARRSR